MGICYHCGEIISDRATKCRYCFKDNIPLVNEEILISSGGNFEGYEIIEYMDFAYGDVVCPNGILGAITNRTFFTISAMHDARNRAIAALKEKAKSVGANAIINIDIDIADLNGQGTMVSANGTPVYIIPKDYINTYPLIDERKAEYERRQEEIRKQKEELDRQKEEQRKQMFAKFEEEEKQRVQEYENRVNKLDEIIMKMEQYSVVERNIVKFIIKEHNATFSGIVRYFSRNVDSATLKGAVDKLVADKIIEVDEYGACKVTNSILDA